MKSITIGFNPKNGKFEIKAPIWANDLIRALPNRRFNKATATWLAPAIRINCAHLEAGLGKASWSQLALQKLAEVKAAVDGSVTPMLPWPCHYQFKTKPFKHQETALRKAFGRQSFAFFMATGTGKTKTLIDLACASRVQNLIDTVIIICPVSVRKNWAREITIHGPYPVDAFMLNSDKPKQFDMWVENRHDFKWLIVGVESIGGSARANDMVLGFLQKYPKTLVCVDESHKIKTHNAIRSMRVCEIGLHAAYKVAMTGTPIAKGVMDLYGQFEFLDPNILGVGDFYSFRNRYAVMGGYEQREIIGYQNVGELMETINPFIYQVRKEEALPDLPPKVYARRYVTLTPDQAKHYNSMVKDLIVFKDDKSLTVKNALSKMLRLQQITGGHLPLDDIDLLSNKKIVTCNPIGKVNPKVQDVLDFCDEIDGSIIVWCRFRPEIEAVASALRAKYGAADVVEVHGGISEEQRDINVNELFQKGKATKLVANAATGGTGLTITAASFEYYYSNDYNYVDRVQSEDRAHRSGQMKTVVIVDVISQIEVKGVLKDTVDILPVLANETKANLAEYVKSRIDDLSAKGEKALFENLAYND